ncbi:Phenylacetaldoxime dehydratase [Colletotrichum higginsianum IMI 349063]|uniref:Phenylacetaldoxime dehydratase n=1 Tax=Colletotrichum higginsianum (strain IMI 349063) TaxID=759273 RepID=A0A1B7Y7H5_COLHI|nr:Phenylacetaldoxime dehydratase [Colletotrichum higginsianum IMI 349063]OBR07960.1 Phenylacetaldoxime dehydratase [Colletotrichum higginsianum IMI 349063]GJC97944.1 phenylacetaldoxime dehydratase [Colletotrichum higginsianum]
MKLSLALLAGAASAFQMGKPPVPQAKTTMTDNFPWRNPFTAETAAAYAAACEAEATFPAAQHTLHDLFDAPPAGLAPWGDGLKAFFSGREYPGGWAGLDRHMYDRNLLVMRYADMPLRVREWIEGQERADGGGGGDGKGLFAVFDAPAAVEGGGLKVAERVVFPEDAADVDRALDAARVAIFAPGALYPVLPLFVAEGSDCESTLADLANYQAVPRDGAVVAWPVSHSRPDVDNNRRDIEFTVKARVLKLNEGATEGEVETKTETETEKKAPSDSAKEEL